MNAFSIIVLFHNNNHTDLVLKSLLKQVKANDEIVIVDDHSSKESLEIFTPYLSNPYVRLIHATDKVANRSYNRNYGVQHTKNPFLLFVDGDIVLLEDCLQSLRVALEKGYAGAIGNIIQGNYTPEQMDIFCGFNYKAFLESDPSLADFIHYDLEYDRRKNLINQNIRSKTEWQYYYSGYCAATREAFDKINGFNEGFYGWGGEDVEFGFRLAKLGRIFYLKESYAYHIPHDRNLYAITVNNRKNMYQFLQESLSPHLELMMSCGLNENILSAIEYVKQEFFALNLPDAWHNLEERTLYVSPITKTNTNGLVSYLDATQKRIDLPLMGLTLPFNNNTFEKAYLTTNIFSYPEALAVKILHECHRVAQNIYIWKKSDRKHIHWQTGILSAFIGVRSSMNRIAYQPAMISDFLFKDFGEYYSIMGGIATKMPQIYIDNLLPTYPSTITAQKKGYFIFNLTNEKIPPETIQRVAENHCMEVKGIYSIVVPENQVELTLSDLIFGELQTVCFPFAYLLKEGVRLNKNDSWWNYKYRNNDIILPDVVKV